MARNFVAASSQYLENSTTPVTAAPFTVAFWGRSTSATVTNVALSIADSAGTSNFWIFGFAGATAGDPLLWQVMAAGAFSQALTTTGYTANQWHHCCAVEASATDRRVFIDGGSKGTNTTSRTPAGIDRVAVGRRAHSAPDLYFGGDVAEVAIWGVALSDDEVALLAKGVSPLTVRPGDLVFYAPLLGKHSPEIDLIGARGLTVNASAAAAAHPRIFYPPVEGLITIPPFVAPVGSEIDVRQGQVTWPRNRAILVQV